MPDIEPVVWRRIHVHSHTTLSGLHAVIQIAMGWDDAHLYEFGARWETYGHNGREPSAYTVAQVLPEVGSGAGYVYDFGDHWTHQIIVEKIHRPAANTHYPRCSAGRRACPPEDCGGPLGYERTLRAIRARKGPRYRELREWGQHKYNPAYFDREMRATAPYRDRDGGMPVMLLSGVRSGRQWATSPAPGRSTAVPRRMSSTSRARRTRQDGAVAAMSASIRALRMSFSVT